MENEKRLIDANALSNAVAESQYYNPHPPGRVHINHINEHNHFLRMILDAPTVDAVEVVHGRWIVSGCGFDCCSECRKVYADGYLTAMGIKARTQFNYCPNCGAKMDGGNEDG